MMCNVCNSVLEKILYKSQSSKSLTSLCTVYEGTVLVYFCTQCGHLQSEEIENIDGYYDKDYDILISSEDEDQIYEVINGLNVYRTSHQVNTLVSKVPVYQNMKILDYGCAKSSTMRELLNLYKDVRPYLFDVSERYEPFWSKFLSRESWATFEIPISWENQFDVVTSFFSLEHMAKPQEALRNVYRVLKVGGIFYGIVPNVFTNSADMIVVDHINHFTPISLKYLMQNTGFHVIEIDEMAHKGALVFVAKKMDGSLFENSLPTLDEVMSVDKKAQKISNFWMEAGNNIRKVEKKIPANRKLAIYGAGFYGSFISAMIKTHDRVECIVDQNPFLQGKKQNGISIVSPKELPKEINTIWVGLNPSFAKKMIDDIAAFKNRNLSYYFL